MKRKQYLLLVVLTVVAGLIGGAVSNWILMARAAVAQEVPTVIKAKQFRLVDDLGNIHSIWGLSAGNANGTINFYDKNGKIRSTLNDGGIGLHDENEIMRMSVSSSGLLISDKNDKSRVAVTEDRISFQDKNKKLRVIMGIDSDDTPQFKLYDEHESLRAALGSTTIEITATGESRKPAEVALILYDKDGKVMWKAP